MKHEFDVGDEVVYWPKDPIKGDGDVGRSGRITYIFNSSNCIMELGPFGTIATNQKNLRSISEMMKVGEKWRPKLQLPHQTVIGKCVENMLNEHFWRMLVGGKIDTTKSGLIHSYRFNMEGVTMNCPKTRELTPEEQIRAKITEVQGIIKGFQERIDEQNERAEQLLSILTSLNWKTTPESMQKKAVEAADSV